MMKQIQFDIDKSFDTFRLQVRGRWDAGITGILGPSGSGKTTLLHCLCGIEKPDTGEIRLDDEVLFSSAQKQNTPVSQRRIGMIFQDDLLFPHMTVRGNVMYGWNPAGGADSFPKEVVRLLDIGHLLKRYPHTLSGGERQRVAIARALMHRPEVLLLDEPVSSLDTRRRFQILNYIKKIHAAWQIPVVYVSHSVAEHLFLARTLFVLDHGRWVGEGSTPAMVMGYQTSEPAVEDWENVFELPVREIKESEGLVILDFGGHPLAVTFPKWELHPRLRIGIDASHIIIAAGKVEDISARNCVPAEVQEMRTGADQVLVRTTVGDHNCFVKITPAACRALNLHPGQRVHLLVKSQLIEILD